MIFYGMMRNVKSKDQDEHIHHEQITQSPQHAKITSPEPIPQSHEQTTSQELTIPSQSYSIITTPRRITRETIHISQSKVPSPGADDTAFPTRDVRYEEAFPTDTSLDAGQDRENVAKTSAMPHEALPMVTSLRGGEGNGSKEDLLVGDIVKDSDKSADKRSDITNEMANVLGTLGSANILASRGLRSVFTTGSLSVATASTCVSTAIATASGCFPTAVNFTTASVATPTTRVTRSSRGVVIGSLSPIPLARDLEAKFAQEDQIIREQAERNSKIARIHAERELEMMITKLDRSNEMVAKYLSEYEQAKAGLSHDEKVELIDELFMYQRHLSQIKKYQDQQNKAATKTERRNFYMSILRSNAGWKATDFKRMTFEQMEEKFIPLDKERFKKLETTEATGIEPTQEKQFKEPKELSEEELKKMMKLVPVVKLYIEALQKFDREDLDKVWILVKETCSKTKATDEKEKELRVELKRLYKPDSRDLLCALQRYMHDPLVWRLYDTCGVHHISTEKGHHIFLLVEKDYPLTKGLTTLMMSNKIQVDQYSKMENELLMKRYIIANSPR
nr:hypothetical protein [Tanacetum cinerariifolium]